MLKKFENLGTALSRNESKMVVGGNFGETEVVFDAAGTCCAHGADLTKDDCNKSMATVKEMVADGKYPNWCCSSCIWIFD